jgi:WD40 repeat protein
MHPAGIILWDVATQEQITTFEFHYGKSLVAFSPDGNLLASEGGFPDSFHIWEVSTHQQIAALDTREFGGSSGARQMIFSPDGEIIAIATNKTVQFWEVAAQKKIRSLDYSGAVTFLAFGANSNALVSAGGLSLDRSRIQFWNILRNRQSARLGSYGPITVSADGKVLAWQRQGIIPDTGVIQFWDTETQQQVAQVEIPLESLFSPGVPFALNTDGSLLAIATRLPDSPLPTIELWDVPRQQILSKFEIGSINGSYADSVVFSPQCH